jgi:hypothetical protein
MLREKKSVLSFVYQTWEALGLPLCQPDGAKFGHIVYDAVGAITSHNMGLSTQGRSAAAE